VHGDDIRNIDWNVTARFGNPYVKVFEEERELNVMLLVDISASGMFGTTTSFKRDLLTELSAVLAFSAIHNNDKAGVILFSDRIEKFIPPKKGKTHILRIIRELLTTQPASRGTDINGALRYLNNMVKKRSIVFLISDFMDAGYEDALKVVSKRHDLVAVRVNDPRESEMPDVGMVRFSDAETGNLVLLDTGNASVRRDYALWWKQSFNRASEIFGRAGVDHTSIVTGRPYVKELLNLFRKREHRA
jgi:uncharacterized protein (DUF58 family)